MHLIKYFSFLLRALVLFVNHEYCHLKLYTGMLVGSLHLTESAQKLPQELVISDDQFRLLESIGQGEPCLVYLQQ